jgi:hypothetical protein
MAVAVYPRLGELLRERLISVAELGWQIERQFGLSVDRKTLYRLTSSAAVQRADLEIAGAAAAVLGVGLEDVFDVRATPLATAIPSPSAELAPEQRRRLTALLSAQGERMLTRAERTELKALIADYGRRVHEHFLHEIAQKRGVSVEQARHDVQIEFDRALQEWQHFSADPRWRDIVAAQGNSASPESAAIG